MIRTLIKRPLDTVRRTSAVLCREAGRAFWEGTGVNLSVARWVSVDEGGAFWVCVGGVKGMEINKGRMGIDG